MRRRSSTTEELKVNVELDVELNVNIIGREHHWT